MVDKNVFKMDLNLMQRFRSLKTSSASIERLLPKTFASDANFNVNPPVLPKQTIDLGPVNPVPARHNSAKPTSPANRLNGTGREMPTSSSARTKETSNASELVSTAQKQSVTKASLQALAAAKAGSSSKTSTASTARSPALPGQKSTPVPKSQTTTSKIKATATKSTLKANEGQLLMRQKEDLYCLQFNGLPLDDVNSDECSFNFECPILSFGDIETAMKVIEPAKSPQATKLPDENLSIPATTSDKKTAENLHTSDRLQPADQQVPQSSVSNETKGNSCAASSEAGIKIAVPASRSLLKRPSAEMMTRLSSSKSGTNISEVVSRQTSMPAGSSLLDGRIDALNSSAPLSAKRARIKITKRRNADHERETCLPLAAPQTDSERSVSIQPEGQLRSEGQQETIYKSVPEVLPLTDSEVKKEPIDFVDLLSLPDEPDDACKENEALLTSASPSSRLTPDGCQTSSNNLNETELKGSVTVPCDALSSAKPKTLDGNVSPQKRPLPEGMTCAPINRQFRRRFQQLLDVSCRKKRVLCHKYFKEEQACPLKTLDKKTDNLAQSLSSEDSLPTTEPPSAGTSTPEVAPPKVIPVQGSAELDSAKTVQSSSEVIIVDDDGPPQPRPARTTARLSKLNRPCPASVKRSLLVAATTQRENNNSSQLPTAVAPLNTRQVTRSSAIPVQRVAPVCVDVPAQHPNHNIANASIVANSAAITTPTTQQQHIVSSLSTPTVTSQLNPISSANAQILGPPVPAKPNECLNPPILALSPPQSIHMLPPTPLQFGPPTVKLVASSHPGLISAPLPSPPKLVQKVAVQHPSIMNTVPSNSTVNSANNNNNDNDDDDVIVVTQTRTPQRGIAQTTQKSQPRYVAVKKTIQPSTPAELGVQEHIPINNSVPRSVQAQAQNSVTPLHQQQQLTQYRPLRQQTLNRPQHVKIGQQQQELQQQPLNSLPTSSPSQEKLYQCGYCGLTGSDMRTVALHIATCGS